MQPPQGAGFVATFVGFAVFPGWGELLADAGAFGVDGAVDRFADLPVQRDAAGVLLVGAFHDTQVFVQILCQFNRHGAEDVLIGLRPVKRRTKVGTARPTG